jgi:hypothetical protein
MHLLSNAAAMLLLLLAPFAHAQNDQNKPPPNLVKHDLGIVANDGATVGDCWFMLLNYPELGGGYFKVHSWKYHSTFPLCQNVKSEKCEKMILGWQVVACVGRADIYYFADNHPPDWTQKWNTDQGGSCFTDGYGRDGAGKVNDKNSCNCHDVGVDTTCT